MGVAERHRLLANDAGLRLIGGMVKRRGCQAHDCTEKNRAKDARFGDHVHAGVEYLCHPETILQREPADRRVQRAVPVGGTLASTRSANNKQIAFAYFQKS
jgi:hypothetical protein